MYGGGGVCLERTVVRNIGKGKGFLQLSGGGCVCVERTVARKFGSDKGFLQCGGGCVFFDRTS